MKRVDYRGLEFLLSPDELAELKSGLEEFDRHPSPLLFSESVLVDFARQAVSRAESVSLDDEDHDALKSLCWNLDSLTDDFAGGVGSGFQKAALRLLRGVRAAATYSCQRCGRDAFEGGFQSRYSESEWFVMGGSVPLASDIDGLEETAASLAAGLVSELNQDDEILDHSAGSHGAVSEVEARVACQACATTQVLSPDLFREIEGHMDNFVPPGAVRSWPGVLSRGDGHTPRSDAAGCICPICEYGQIQLFAERVLVEHTAGKQSGTTRFSAASTLDPPREWTARLTADSWGSNASSVEEYPAGFGYRLGVGCSTPCWEAKGLQGAVDVPAALLAACAVTMVAPVFGWEPEFRLDDLTRRFGAGLKRFDVMARAGRYWVQRLPKDAHFSPDMVKEAEELLSS